MASPSDVDGVLVVDKASGSTSHDVVAVARGALGTRAIGHTGTLDPMATGVLVLVVGEATKLVGSLGALRKHYDATLKLGVSTRSLDADGEPDGEGPVPKLTRDDVQAIAARFVGEHDQRAPLVSAIKQGGKALYKRARGGEAVEAPVRRVRLDALAVQAVREGEIDLSLACGSGYYVRALARDLSEALGTVGHLTALRRTQNGAFGLEGAVTFAALRAGRGDEAARAAMRTRLTPLAEVCRSLPHLVLDEAGTAHARQGRAIPFEHVQGDMPTCEPGASLVALDEGGTPVALVVPSGSQLRVARGFRVR
ncbi:MAG: tRNA pseudouridine(55) synthase TruB [Polyangiales bacterium]